MKAAKDVSSELLNVRPGAMSALLEELFRAPDPSAGRDEPVLARGTRVGRFEILGEVGRGGFGVVYEARDVELGRTVAFKVVRPGRRSPAREGRLLLEAEAAARLSHPNIVTLFDLGRSEHGPYLVLELLRGETVGVRAARGPLPRAEALRIAIETARGLAHAHAAGVVHRDLAPGNVFLCDDGRVKILDLGMAQAFGREKVAGGTPGYMAPEQRAGLAEDSRTDVYGLGALLATMLGAGVPEGGLGAGDRLQGVRGGALPRVLARMLAREPERRYPDAGEALAALEDATPARDAARQRRWRWATALLAAAVAFAGGAAFVRRPTSVGLPGPSVAVMPFLDGSSAHDQGHLADGLAAEIRAELVDHAPGLRVAGHASALRVRALPLAEAAKRLQVAALVTGEVRTGIAVVIVEAHLVRAVDGRELWSETYETPPAGVFTVQERIAKAVAGALSLRLASTPARTGAEPPAEAVERYWRARQLMDAEVDGREREQLAWLEQAVALAPGFGRAHALLGFLRFSADMMGDFERGCALGLADLDHAVRVQPDLGEAYSIRGYVRLYCMTDVEGATADTERALALDPGGVDTWRRAGILYLYTGHLDEAIRLMRRAVDADPLLPRNWTWLARAYWAAGRIAEARAVTERALALEPDAWYVAMMGQFDLEEGRPQEALAAFERANPGSRERGLAMALHDLGRQAEAEAMLQELRRRYPWNAFGCAQVYAWWGDRERAFEELARAVEERGYTRVELLTNPILRPLRDDPRWPVLLRRAGFEVP